MSAAAVLAVLAAAELIGLILLVVILVRTRRDADRLREQLASSPRSVPRTPAGLAVRAVVETAARVRARGVVGGLLMSSLDDLTRWIAEQRSEIAQVAAPDGTVTIFFSDIENSTALNEQVGDARWMRILDAHDALIRRQISRRGGHVVKTQGDGFMVVFGEPARAAQAAVDIQQSLHQRPHAALRRTPIKVRVGMHVGEVVSRDGDYFGRNVAMAARIAAQARGGEILVSEELRSALGDADAFVLRPRGEVELRGLSDRHVLWELRAK